MAGIWSSDISDAVNAVATFESARTKVLPNSWGQNVQVDDVATSQTVNVLISQFAVMRRLAYIEAVGGSIDTRLYWVATEFPMEVHESDVFIVVEYGASVRYVVQAIDAEAYLSDTTVCACSREV